MPSGAGRSPAPRPQRAHARRNYETILDAAVACLTPRSEVSVADVAAAWSARSSGLTGFVMPPTRWLSRRGTHPPGGVLVHQFRNILLAAYRELPAERIRGVPAHPSAESRHLSNVGSASERFAKTSRNIG
jgi:hypothetical protein